MVAALESSGAGMAVFVLSRIFPGKRVGSPVFPDRRRSRRSALLHVYRRNVTERIGGWKDFRELQLPPEADLFSRAREAAGLPPYSFRRLTALKFPASVRKNVYRDKPSHEQAWWFEEICSRPDFEPSHLIEMMVAGEVARAMPARELFRILIEQVIKRSGLAISRKSGLNAMFWTAKGGGIEHAKKYKGL